MHTLIANMFRAIDAQDWSALEGFFHPHVVYERPGYSPFNGIARLRQFYQHERVIASGEHLIERIVAQDNCATCWGRFVGTTRDGNAADELFVDVYMFEDGKIKQRRSYFFRPAI